MKHELLIFKLLYGKVKNGTFTMICTSGIGDLNFLLQWQ
jgi:hypothetical protein